MPLCQCRRLYRQAEKRLDEEVLERGNNFSAGQRHAFLRTVLHRPSVMILDEATANIDTETELLIQDSLEKNAEYRNYVGCSAPSFDCAKHADRIIVLPMGKSKSRALIGSLSQSGADIISFICRSTVKKKLEEKEGAE